MPTRKRQGHIVVLGGGSFSADPDSSLFHRYILSLCQRQPAHVCFVPTASADSAAYLVQFYRAFSGLALPTDLTLFDSPTVPRRPPGTADLSQFVASQDIFFVGGGSTANLLALWRVHGLDHLFRDAWSRGAILCGVSAGMLCWFRGGVTDSFGDLEAFSDGLGLIDATACPHYDSEPERRPTYQTLIQTGMQAGYAAEDFAALHFHGTMLEEVVSFKQGASAYRVALEGGQVVETRIEGRFLGDTAAV